MIQDLHSHTYYSFCGEDAPEEIVEAAIAGGIEVLGISDHNYGIINARKDIYKYADEDLSHTAGRTLARYLDHIRLIRDRYADRIRILCGIEVATTTSNRRLILPDDADISAFDYCLVENLDAPTSILGGDLLGFAERAGCPVGVAHTDLLGFLERRGEDAYTYFRQMAERGIFWEMNVSYDSIHKWYEHPYMLRFFEDAEQQALVRESGLRLSVGFDGHRVGDYLPTRVSDYCRRITEMGIKLAFED